MKFGSVVLLSLCATSTFAQSPVIRTIAGNGRNDLLQEGASALESSVRSPNALAFDHNGNLLISTLFGFVYKLTPDGGLFTAIASPPPQVLGCSFWAGMAVDRENRIYLADMGCHQVLRTDGNGNWAVVAGTGHSGFSGDEGPAERAELSKPHGLAFDNLGNLYIADYGNLRIRVVSPDGIIRTYAGNGRDDRSRGDGGPARDASIRPVAIALDPSGNLFVADFPSSVPEPYYANHSIRMIAPDGEISTPVASSADRPEVVLPMSLAAPSTGLLYFGDMYRVRAVDTQGVRTIAGSLQAGFSGDGGPAVDALLYAPQGLAVDSSGDIYVADIVNMRVRRIESAPTRRIRRQR